MQQYVAQRSAYDTWHIKQLNALVSQMNLDDESGNYFSQPLQFSPYDQLPPPNPFDGGSGKSLSLCVH